MASDMPPDEQSQPQQYYDGLHVVPRQPSSPAPEVAPTGHDDPTQYRYSVMGDGGQWAKKEAEDDQPATETTAPVAKSWWRRKRVIFTAVAALFILIIALGTGLGVGLKKGKNKDDKGSDSKDDNSDDTKYTVPECTGGLCSQIVSATVHTGHLLVFARTTDDTIAYRNHSTSWAEWQDLGKMKGGFISQPTIQSWKVNDEIPRLDVLATGGDPDHLYGTWFSEAEGWARKDGKWDSLWSRTQKPISTCDKPAEGLHMWMSQGDHIGFNKWEQNDEDDLSDKAKDGVTQENGQFSSDDTLWEGAFGSTTAQSTVSVVCRDAEASVDLVYFDYWSDALQHTYYVDGDGWTLDQVDGRRASEFIGDPISFTFDDTNRFDTFMVRKDNSLDHYVFDPDPENLQALQGSILSQPGVVSLKDSIFDIVALGTNGTLQHLQIDDHGRSDWEDLEIRAYSAPTMIHHKSQVFLFAVSKSGELLSWTRDTSISETWKGSLKSENLGGNLSTNFFTTNS